MTQETLSPSKLLNNWAELKSVIRTEALSSIIKNNKTKERRERILNYLVAQSESRDRLEAHPTPIEAAIQEIQPKEIIDWIRPQKSEIHGRLLAPAQGRYKVRASTLRDEIAGIKKTILAVIQSLKQQQARQNQQRTT